jgi:hypothetical protein
MNATDITFLVIGILWCILWAFGWVRAKRQNRRIPYKIWRHFYKFLAFGVLGWASTNPTVRERYPWLSWVAFLIVCILTLPAFKMILAQLNNEEPAHSKPVSSE